jgi:pSer/pThr/pTyr-binding forkhead associated (FHA) protein
MARIFLKFNEAVLKEIPLDRPQMTIGRKPDNDLVIDNPAVSGHHARIVQEHGSFFVEDLGSTNGTFVNDAKVLKHQLRNTDRVGVGKHLLVYQDEVAEAAPPPPPAAKEADSDKTMILDTKKQRELLKAAQTMQFPAGIPKPAVEKVGNLVAVSGSTDQKEYELTGRLSIIGSEDSATIRLTGWFAPKNAALITRRGEGYFVSVSEGGKKILLNGETVQGSKELRDGDILVVAGVQFQFVAKDLLEK